MRQAGFTFILFLTALLNAESIPKDTPNWKIKSEKKDSTLKVNEALFVFHFTRDAGKLVTEPVKFSYNGKQKTAARNAEGKYFLKVKPGKYKFMFYLTPEFYEITTDSIPIASGYRKEIDIRFHSAYENQVMKKPVIYVYSEIKQEVKIKLNLKGELNFTYPEYKNEWKFAADSAGYLSMNNKVYPYLFWEGKCQLEEKDNSTRFGFIVKQENIISFLEEKLRVMGLNEREQNDFITYWAPQMTEHRICFVHFLFNEEYAKYASLNCEPKPDNLFRVFMLWEDGSNISSKHPSEQMIPTVQRNGLTIIEWGGTQMGKEEKVMK